MREVFILVRSERWSGIHEHRRRPVVFGDWRASPSYNNPSPDIGSDRRLGLPAGRWHVGSNGEKLCFPAGFTVNASARHTVV